MQTKNQRAQFWNRKILSWEQSRYSSFSLGWGASLQARMIHAADALNSLPKNVRLVDIGCGSGRLFAKLDRTRFSHLLGVDFSDAAIRKANLCFNDSNVSFQCLDITKDLIPSAEYYVGLGLLDWLSDSEITTLFQQIKGKRFLFSFSEARPSPARSFHFFYTRLVQLFTNAPFVPRYHSSEHIKRLIGNSSEFDVFIFRPTAMAFGSFVSNYRGNLFDSEGVCIIEENT